jgi:hypothetical protein
VWGIFTASYYSLPAGLAAVVIAGWLAGAVVARRSGWTDGLRRACLIGPVIGIAIFVLTAPYGEMRFAYPALLLLFAAGAIALAPLPRWLQMSVAAGVLLWAAATAFPRGPSLVFAGVGGVMGLIGAGVALVHWTWRLTTIVSSVCFALIGAAVYIYWDAYVSACAELSDPSWSHEQAYPDIADVWHHVRSALPPGSTIAYANTYFTYPLMGYTYDHRVVHAPTRRGLERFIDMPPIATPTTGEEITGHIEVLLRQDPDREQWLRRLRDSGAAYLVVMKRGPSAAAYKEPAPELVFTAEDPTHFQRVYDSDAGSIFKIVW